MNLQAPDDPDSGVLPLLEVQMVLESSQIQWRPDLGEGTDGDIGIVTMSHQWAKRFLETGNLMRRLDVGEGSYSREIEEDYDVLYCVSQLQQAVLNNQDRCDEFAQSFLQYEDLWTMDMNATLTQWLTERTVHNEGALPFPGR
jgi:dynein heavy chain, axonemal